MPNFNDIDNDLIKRATPENTPETRSLHSNDKIKTITKAKLQEYIESFFKKMGENRELLRIVSPRGITFNIDKSFDPNTDPTERKLQVARYFSELRNILPSIVIMDGGVIPLMHNIGLISDSYYTADGYWVGHYPVLRQVPIKILAAARDMETADELSSILSLLFNELRNLAGGNYMQGKPEEGQTWTVTLPNEGVPCSAVNELEISNEPLEKIHYAEITVDDVRFEDVIRVRQKLPTVQPGQVIVQDPNLSQTLAPVIDVPDTVSINDQIAVIVRNITDTMRIVMSDGTRATLSYNMILTPRKLGPVSIQVVNYELSPPDRVVAQKQITIV